MPKANAHIASKLSLSPAEIIRDYRTAYISRLSSLIGRREVLSGKAKFGIFGDGKEVAQVALARSFKKGDWRSGYYRDQTLMMALGIVDVKKFFAQLYADTCLDNEPCSGGRQMNAHFATRFLDSNGRWLNQCMMFNSSADMSPTGGQMSRLLGLAYASKLYRQEPKLASLKQFFVKGNEVAFGTIGDASTSEGIFWEVLNAGGVLQVPLHISVWDDGYGISVPIKYQTTKESISEIVRGFQREKTGAPGYEIFKVKGWDYPALLDVYARSSELARKEHVPVLVHVHELTQPQGHSTSGSHERYKSDARMAFEQKFDCLTRMREWMVSEGVTTGSEIQKVEDEATKYVNQQRQQAWDDVMQPIEREREQLLGIYERIKEQLADPDVMSGILREVKRIPTLQRRLLASSMQKVLVVTAKERVPARAELSEFAQKHEVDARKLYNSFVHNENERSATKVAGVEAKFSASSKRIDGREVIQATFDQLLARHPNLFIIGEDVGKLGGVNLEFEGLQAKYGEHRVTDTGIREATILGQGIGAALRGLRPIVDIQYLDYVLYCFQVMSDDLATLHYRSAGGQIAPVIVRTKGHRLEGIWHTGSPLGVLLNGIRGMHLCVPRNMVQAAGFYNTLMKSDDPALVIEVLNGYRLKEMVPDNLSEFCLELGAPEVVKAGKDVTVVTYGACVRVAEEAHALLEKVGIELEVIDVQSLLPFDKQGVILSSIKKTNAAIFFDEDVPGGASAYMMQQALEKQGAYDFLDAKPRTLTAQEHRGAYASDGDYYSKPSAEQLFRLAYEIMREREPRKFPAFT